MIAEWNGENIAQVSIPDGTPVQLRLAKTVSSATAKAGAAVDFVVENDVNIGGLTAVSEGSFAKGSVLSIKRRGIFGIGGRLVMRLTPSGCRAPSTLPRTPV